MSYSSFADMKANRAELNAKLQTEFKPTSKWEKDERYWSPTLNKDGVGSALIRFMPAPPNEPVPYIKIYEHAFKGPGGWYIEKSLTTFEEADPVTELNSRLWDTGIEGDRKMASSQKRSLRYIANVLVINDPANADNNGKVFLYKFGKKIYEKIQQKINPPFEDDESIIPFDPFDGVNFKLRLRKVDNFPNYDNCDFEANKTPLAKTDAAMEKLWRSCYSLQAIFDRDDPKNGWKTYDDLAKRLARVLKTSQSESAVKSIPVFADNNTDDNDDDLSFISKLIAED